MKVYGSPETLLSSSISCFTPRLRRLKECQKFHSLKQKKINFHSWSDDDRNSLELGWVIKRARGASLDTFLRSFRVQIKWQSHHQRREKKRFTRVARLLRCVEEVKFSKSNVSFINPLRVIKHILWFSPFAINWIHLNFTPSVVLHVISTEFHSSRRWMET